MAMQRPALTSVLGALNERARTMARIPRNPFMSMWLSAANRVAQTGRAKIAAATRREQADTLATATRSVERFWTQALRRTPTRKNR